MPNIAAVLKEEIRRLARKEVRQFASGAKQSVARYRREIAQLRRSLLEQQKKLARFAARCQDRVDPAESEEESLSGSRYSARSVRAQRKRLGLSAEDYGRLVGVSGLTVYNWEHGKSRPRKAQLASLISVRGIGKREATMRLEAAEKSAAEKRRRSKPKSKA